jgi:rubrerythrin
MRDVEYDPKEESAYECFSCGTIVIAETNPGSCDDCGNEMRNRLMPIE